MFLLRYARRSIGIRPATTILAGPVEHKPAGAKITVRAGFSRAFLQPQPIEKSLMMFGRPHAF